MSRFLFEHRTFIITLIFSVFTVVCVLVSSNVAFAALQDGKGTGVEATQASIGPMAMVGTFIGNFILYIGSRITWVGGMILNTCIEYFILNTSGLIGNGTPVGTAITVVWTLIRDICNLAFIAGFIYVGIKTIIDADSASTKKMLASIIIAAFLINFSLLIAKLVIDVGNIIAVALYNNIANGQNISVKFGEILGVTSLYDVTNPATQQAMVAANAGGNIAFYFMATIMLIVAGFVLAAGGILLMIRFVALILILCFSPILFAATVFPATAGTAKKLWGLLINYTLFAPAYLLMLFVSIYLLDSVVYALRGDNKLADAMNAGQTSAFGTVLAFGIAIFFLVMSLQIATKFGIAGGEKAVALGNNLRGKVQSSIGRNTIGRASASLLKDYEKLNAGAKQTRTGRFMGRALKYGSLGVLDDRNIRGTLEGGKKAKFGGQYSHADDVSYASDQKKRQATIIKQTKFDKAVDNRSGLQRMFGATAPTSLLGRNPASLTPAERQQQTDLEEAILHASTKQLEELEQSQRIAMVSMMTQAQLDALNKSENLTESEKDDINDARTAVIKSKYGNAAPFLQNPVPGVTPPQTSRDALAKASGDELVSLGATFLAQPTHAMRLTSSQMDDLKKKLPPSEFSQVTQARTQALDDLVSGINPAFDPDGKDASFILNQKPNEIANMPAGVLKRLSSRRQTQIPISALEKIVRDGTLTKADQADIRQNIEIHIGAGHLGGVGGVYDQWLTQTPIGRTFGN